MSKLLEKVDKKLWSQIPLHYLSATEYLDTDEEIISFFNTENDVIEKIGTKQKLFYNFNKHIVKYKM